LKGVKLYTCESLVTRVNSCIFYQFFMSIYDFHQLSFILEFYSQINSLKLENNIVKKLKIFWYPTVESRHLKIDNFHISKNHFYENRINLYIKKTETQSGSLKWKQILKIRVRSSKFCSFNRNRRFSQKWEPPNTGTN
jgi:hypothetical protein